MRIKPCQEAAPTDTGASPGLSAMLMIEKSENEGICLRDTTAKKSTQTKMDYIHHMPVGRETTLPHQTRTRTFLSTRPFIGRHFPIRIRT